MASRIFTEAVVIGITLEEVRQALAVAVDKLNKERDADGVQGFATVYVSSLMREPKPLAGISFIVSYSDHDDYASQLVAKILRCVVRNIPEERLFYLLRDPYCA